MGECEISAACPFFQSGAGDEADQLKKDYCRNNNLHCAIYMVAQVKGSDNLPSDILPTEKDKAYKVIAEG